MVLYVEDDVWFWTPCWRCCMEMAWTNLMNTLLDSFIALKYCIGLECMVSCSMVTWNVWFYAVLARLLIGLNYLVGLNCMDLWFGLSNANHIGLAWTIWFFVGIEVPCKCLMDCSIVLKWTEVNCHWSTLTISQWFSNAPQLAHAEE